MEDVLRRHDPIELISIGAPHDEYDPEVGTILPRLKEASSARDVQQVLHEEFTKWFNAELAGPSESYQAAAQELWQGWLRFEAHRLSMDQDVEIVDPAENPARYGKDVMDSATVVRIAERYFVETTDEPGRWWMGERSADGAIVLWGQYGSYEEAFAQH